MVYDCVLNLIPRDVSLLPSRFAAVRSVACTSWAVVKSASINRALRRSRLSQVELALDQLPLNLPL